MFIGYIFFNLFFSFALIKIQINASQVSQIRFSNEKIVFLGWIQDKFKGICAFILIVRRYDSRWKYDGT